MFIGNKLGITIFEDCVQSGSIYSNYKGNEFSDIIVWSCGFDKTPSCFGGGIGYFKNTQNGKYYYDKINSLINTYKISTFKDRFITLFGQFLHFIITKKLVLFLKYCNINITNIY